MMTLCKGSDLNHLIADILKLKINYEGMDNRFYNLWGPGTKFKNLKKIKAAAKRVDEEIQKSKKLTSIDDTIQLLEQAPDIGTKNLVVTIQNFTKTIVEFMHYSYHYSTETEMIHVSINNCPMILEERNALGLLPIQCYVRGHSPCIRFIAEIGRRCGIGGSDSRGGLLSVIHQGPHRGRNLLQTIAFHRDVTALKSLMEAEPSLFEKKDIRKYHLLKYAVMDFRPEMNEKSTKLAKLLIRMDPSCLLEKDKDGYKPLYYTSKDPNLIRVLIQSRIKLDPLDVSIGGLYALHKSGELVIEYILNQMYNDVDQIFELPDAFENDIIRTEQGRNELAWDMIEETINPFHDVPILHQTIEQCPQYIQKVLERFPDSVHVRDEKNRLPIHTALSKGLNWSMLVPILHANNQHLQLKDPFTKLPPFAVAAACISCDLRTVFYLLRRNPQYIEVMIRGKTSDTNQRIKKRRFAKK